MILTRGISVLHQGPINAPFVKPTKQVNLTWVRGQDKYTLPTQDSFSYRPESRENLGQVGANKFQ